MDTFPPHSVFDRLVRSQEVEGELAEQHEVLLGVTCAGAALVFVEGDVENPVAAVLYPQWQRTRASLKLFGKMTLQVFDTFLILSPAMRRALRDAKGPVKNQ